MVLEHPQLTLDYLINHHLIYIDLQINDKPKKGKGIASMVLGIIAVLYCLCAFAAFDDLDYTFIHILVLNNSDLLLDLF